MLSVYLGEKEELGAFGAMVFVFPSHSYSAGDAEYLPALGKWGVKSFFCFACLFIFYFLNCLYLNKLSYVYSSFCLSDPPGRGGSVCVGLSYHVGLNHRLQGGF